MNIEGLKLLAELNKGRGDDCGVIARAVLDALAAPVAQPNRKELDDAIYALEWHYENSHSTYATDEPRKRDARALLGLKRLRDEAPVEQEPRAYFLATPEGDFLRSKPASSDSGIWEPLFTRPLPKEKT